jgi:hypothetical protein
MQRYEGHQEQWIELRMRIRKVKGPGSMVIG